MKVCMRGDGDQGEGTGTRERGQGGEQVHREKGCGPRGDGGPGEGTETREGDGDQGGKQGQSDEAPRPQGVCSADLEDLEAGDVQDAQEGGALAGAAV